MICAENLPQSYATLDLDDDLFVLDTVGRAMLGCVDQRRYRLGETAYDPEHNLLYVIERFVEEVRPVVHVWQAGE